MKEKILGALLPSSPDFVPIIKAVREKYDLPGIYLGDEIVLLEKFHQDI